MTLIFVFIHLQICRTPIEQFTQPDHFTPGKISALKIILAQLASTTGPRLTVTAFNSQLLMTQIWGSTSSPRLAAVQSIDPAWPAASPAACYRTPTSSNTLLLPAMQGQFSLRRSLLSWLKKFLRVPFLDWFSFFYICWICFLWIWNIIFFCQRSHGPPRCQCLTTPPARWAHCPEQTGKPPVFIHFSSMFFCIKIYRNHSVSFAQIKCLIHFLEISLNYTVDWREVNLELMAKWAGYLPWKLGSGRKKWEKTGQLPTPQIQWGWLWFILNSGSTMHQQTSMHILVPWHIHGLWEKGCQCVIGALD